ncbi:MAG: hypothetical protein KKF41_12335, partial [Actinobacteria bacterium]|nr:hypothetical protein [Actinomycetota bacterium]MBU1943842.1 hypothetical protein [Actinomycetota bacterium]MBU2688363.1 hypothetical protein [Actinomycetota bacterium]
IGNLLNKTTGLNPNVIVQAIHGPTNSGVTNPRTGTGFDPSQSVLRRLLSHGKIRITEIEAPWWWPFEDDPLEHFPDLGLPKENSTQIVDAQLNDPLHEGEPQWDPQPW